MRVTYTPSPQRQPDHHKPNREPLELYSSHTLGSRQECSDKERNQQYQQDGRNVHKISHGYARVMYPFDELRKVCCGMLRGPVELCALMQWVGCNVKVVEGLFCAS